MVLRFHLVSVCGTADSNAQLIFSGIPNLSTISVNTWTQTRKTTVSQAASLKVNWKDVKLLSPVRKWQLGFPPKHSIRVEIKGGSGSNMRTWRVPQISYQAPMQLASQQPGNRNLFLTEVILFICCVKSVSMEETDSRDSCSAILLMSSLPYSLSFLGLHRTPYWWAFVSFPFFAYNK